jgi:3-oxoadipate enol-lactonase
VAELLCSRYRVIFPDLRGHGDSAIGDGPATMEKHAADLRNVMDDAGIGRAPIIGVSIGGYLLFEFWRRYHSRVAALALANTKAPADNAQGRAARLEAANDVLECGTEPFFQSMLARTLGATTRESRPDLAHGALRMMRRMSPQDVALVQRGMADRPDSVETLKMINVPTLLITGDEDILTGVNEAELMRRHIPGSQLRVIPKAGHYAAFEQPEQAGRLLRQFLDSFAGAA